MVDGNAATLVDLSTVGAQVVSPTMLKPNQRVRMALHRRRTARVRFNAAVAWASFEIPPKSGPRYRAGIEFVDADGAAVDAFCAHGHKRAEIDASDLRSAARQSAICSTSSLTIVSSRSEPVETIAAGTPDTSSSRAM